MESLKLVVGGFIITPGHPNAMSSFKEIDSCKYILLTLTYFPVPTNMLYIR